MSQQSSEYTGYCRWKDLAIYNAECHRGIVHTPEYDQRMADEQALFDAEREAELIADGYEPLADGGWIKIVKRRR